MNANRRAPLADLPHRIRERLASWPARFRQWREDLREDPSLLWRTLTVRLALWLVLGLVLVFAARWLTFALTPDLSDAAFEGRPMATLYVACTVPHCRVNYTTHQPIDFDAWPLECQGCGAASVRRASLCRVCKKWFATAPDEHSECPFCTAAKVSSQPHKPTTSEPTNPDDDEDPW